MPNEIKLNLPATTEKQGDFMSSIDINLILDASESKVATCAECVRKAAEAKAA